MKIKINELRKIIRESIRQKLKEFDDFNIDNYGPLNSDDDAANFDYQRGYEDGYADGVVQGKIEATHTVGLNERSTAPAPTKPAPGPKIAPGKPTTKPDKPRRPLGNPNVDPKPKAKGKMNESEKEIVNKIVNRFKSR